MTGESFFPKIISDLPQAHVPVEGTTAYLLQGEEQQVVFMSFDRDVAFPQHFHEAQWGVVLNGEGELTIGGEVRILRRGDTYFIPRGAAHSARAKAGFKDVTLFNQKDRYSILPE